MGRCPKPRSEPSFGEGSKNSQNFTAKGTRTVVCKRYVLRSGALCGEALEFLEPFPEGALSGVWAVPQGFCLRFARLESFWKKGLVEFWEFLEPSPKEGSKRGLGRRPKVF